MALASDTRGQSIGIAVFFLSLIAGAFVIWIVRMAGNPILADAANATNDPTANAATGWFQAFVTYLPAIFLLIGMFGLIVLSIYLRGIRQ